MRLTCCITQGDPDRLRGILLNLYTNAAKFTRRGAIALRVSVAGPNYRCDSLHHCVKSEIFKHIVLFRGLTTCHTTARLCDA